MRNIWSLLYCFSCGGGRLCLNPTTAKTGISYDVGRKTEKATEAFLLNLHFRTTEYEYVY